MRKGNFKTMASVEELLAKYGKGEDMSHPDYSTSNSEASAFDKRTSETEGERVGSTAISLNNTISDTSDTNNPYEHGSFEGATNRDGRRLVSDTYQRENQHLQNEDEPDEDILNTSDSGIDSNFVFDDDDEDFSFETATPTEYREDEPTPTITHVQEEYVPYSETSSNEDYGFALPEKEHSSLPDTFNVEDYNNSFSNDEDEYPEVYVASGQPVQDTSAQIPDNEVVDTHQNTTISSNNPYAPEYPEGDQFTARLSELMPAPAETHAGLASFSTFMFPPFGAVAVHHAMRTFTTAYNGEAEESTSHSSKALAWSIAAIVAGALLMSLVIAYKVNPAMFDTLFTKIGLLDNEY